MFLFLLLIFTSSETFDSKKPLFKVIDKTENRGLYPVLQLISNIKNNNWKLISHAFSTPEKAGEFETYFEITEVQGGFLNKSRCFLIYHQRNNQNHKIQTM
jgi:hypothetical protein